MNKKIFILLAILAALALVFVACDDQPVTDETTVSTEAPTDPADTPTEESTTADETPTEDATTEGATNEDATTEEVTTEEATTEEATTEPDNTYEVDLTTVSITGSYTTLWQGSQLAMPVGNMVVLHYGSIDLGEMDLSKYSKVTVTYATPAGADANGGVYDNQYDATGKCVKLLNTLPEAQIAPGVYFEYLPADGTVVASAEYSMSATNLELTTVEIDLSEINHNGDTYLTFDFRTPANDLGATTYLVCVTDIVFA